MFDWKYEGIINIALKHRGKNMNKDMVQPKVVKDNKSQYEIQTELMERILDEMISNRDLLETKLNELIDLIDKKKRGTK